MLTTVVCIYSVPWCAFQAKRNSPGHHPNAKIPQKLLGNPRIVKFEPDKEPVPTPVSPVNCTHNHLYPASILRPLHQLV